MDDDLYEYSEDGNYRLAIWETSNAPDLGFMRWNIQYRYPGLGWYSISATSRYMTFGEALKQGRKALAKAVSLGP